MKKYSANCFLFFETLKLTFFILLPPPSVFICGHSDYESKAVHGCMSELDITYNYHAMTLLTELPAASAGPRVLIFTTSTANETLSGFLSDDFNFEVCMRKLSLKEQRRVWNSRFSRDKELVSRLFTKFVLNYVLYLQKNEPVFDPWAELHFEFNQYGKPTIRGQKELGFEYNTSSSNDLVCIVVQINSRGSVGVDLSHESQDSVSPTDFMDQFLDIFSSAERTQIDQIGDISHRYVTFNHFWTLKEAFTKLVGCGLNVDLSSFEFELPTGKMVVRDSLVHSLDVAVTQYSIEWLSGISVDYSNLEDRFKDDLGFRPVFCHSGVLRAGPKLPVLISCMNQEPDLVERSVNYHISMEKLLLGLVD